MQPAKDFGPSCISGDTKNEPIVLLGDSTARAILPMIQPYASNQELKVISFIKAGCEVSSIVDFVPEDIESKNCSDFYLNSIRSIEKLKPKIVVIASDTGTLKRFLHISDSKIITYGLNALLGKIDNTYTKVILVSSLSKQKSLINCIPADLTITKSCFSKPIDFAWLNSLENEMASKFGAHYFRLNSFLCTKSLCPPIIDSTPVFYDGAHLTSKMADRLSFQFSFFMKKIN
jgi:hypothetical protein